LSATIAYSKEFLLKYDIDMLRDAISLPGVAKHILSSYIQSETLYYIENKQLYDGIHMSEVGGQSIVFTRQNTDKFPYVHGYDANSLYLYCLGEGQYCGEPITYTQYSEHGRKSTCLVRETVKTSGATGHMYRYKHYNTIDDKRSILYVRYMLEQGEFADVPSCMVTTNVKLKLSKGELKKIRKWFTDNNISMKCMFVNVFMDAEFKILDIDNASWIVIDFSTMDEENQAIARIAHMTREVYDSIQECRREILRQRGYTVINRTKHISWPCTESEQNYCKSERGIVLGGYAVCPEIDPLASLNTAAPEYVKRQDLIECILEKKVFGFITCDIHTSLNEREYFKNFAPIIKHTIIEYKDVGEFMQRMIDDTGMNMGKRDCVIDSYYGEGITIIDEYFVWLIEHGAVCTHIEKFVRYAKLPIFKSFVNEITERRIEGDRDSSTEMLLILQPSINI